MYADIRAAGPAQLCEKRTVRGNFAILLDRERLPIGERTEEAPKLQFAVLHIGHNKTTDITAPNEAQSIIPKGKSVQ